MRIKLGRDAELDHYVARAKGGATSLDNLRWVHAQVNRMKGDLSVRQWFRLMIKILGVAGYKVTKVKSNE